MRAYVPLPFKMTLIPPDPVPSGFDFVLLRPLCKFSVCLLLVAARPGVGAGGILRPCLPAPFAPPPGGQLAFPHCRLCALGAVASELGQDPSYSLAFGRVLFSHADLVAMNNQFSSGHFLESK